MSLTSRVRAWIDRMAHPTWDDPDDVVLTRNREVREHAEQIARKHNIPLNVMLGSPGNRPAPPERTAR